MVIMLLVVQIEFGTSSVRHLAPYYYCEPTVTFLLHNNIAREGWRELKERTCEEET